jgi:biopolymer transport protein ExbD
VKQLLNKDELPVVIQADSRADHGVFSDVWSEVKNAGAKKISLSTRND